MNYDGTFTLDGKFYPLKAFVTEEIYIGGLSKVFWDACREENMGLSLKPYDNNKNWRENKNNRRTLKYSATKADTESEEADYSSTVFSDLTFTVAAASDQVQSYTTSAISAITEDTTIKGIFNAIYSQIQVSGTTTTSDTETVTLVIPNPRVAMLAKKGATLFDQGGNSYLINALMLLGCTSFDHGIYKPKYNGGTNSPYLLQLSLSPY